jgi:hypothetical protein
LRTVAELALRFVTRRRGATAVEEVQMRAAGVDGPVIDVARPLIEDLHDFERHRRLQPLRDLVERPKRHIVLTSGSGFSGTGAVTDFLSQCRRIEMPFRRHELSCLKAKHGAVAFLGGSTTVQTVTAFVRACVLGVPFKPVMTEQELRRAKRQALIRTMRTKPEPADRLVTACRMLLRDIDLEDPVPILSRFLNAALRVHGRGPCMYLNNPIHQNAIAVFGLLEDATCLAVVRDARDQYVSRCLESRNAQLSVRVYVERRLRHGARFDAYRHPRVQRIQFEEFVHEETVRAGLLRALGLSAEETIVDRKRFNPAESQRNVGMYRTWPDRAAMEYIERRLPHQLWVRT